MNTISFPEYFHRARLDFLSPLTIGNNGCHCEAAFFAAEAIPPGTRDFLQKVSFARKREIASPNCGSQ